MDSVKAFYRDEPGKTCLEKNFFVFHSFAKTVLDLLEEHTQADPDCVNYQLKLLDTTYFLAYNQMLDTHPVASILDDFASG